MKNNEPSTEELAYTLKNAHRTAKAMKGLDKLLKKYETAQSTVLVMDDYDGGYIDAIKMIVRDLKNLKKPLDKSEKSGIV